MRLLGLAQHPRREHLGAHARHPQPPLAVAAQHGPVGRAGARAGDVEVGERGPVAAREGPRASGVPGAQHPEAPAARPTCPRRRAPRRTSSSPVTSTTTATPVTRPSTAEATRTASGDERDEPMGPACAVPADRVGASSTGTTVDALPRAAGLPDRRPRARRRRLPRGLGAAATGARRGRRRRAAAAPCCCSSTRRSSPPASAPTRTSGPADPGGAPVIDVDRGGKITFHGPGQLVGYPIVPLPDHVKVVDYVRRRRGGPDRRVPRPRRRRPPGCPAAAACGCGPTTAAAPERKIAAIGIRVSRGVTMHGFALNCDVDLGWYDRFVPCGIADAGVTSLTEELGRRGHGLRRAARSSSGT